MAESELGSHPHGAWLRSVNLRQMSVVGEGKAVFPPG